ncbi:MAG: helix-turn-helix domain-containing protein [Nitrosopumilaceae archaeon]|nr:helix-turn-helix domain-containing protein [Nitrosopumilaceae archaeon]
MVEESQITIFDATPESRNHEYKVSADELQKSLAKFNLTSNQSKVYIFLGKYGSKTAPEVCKALKIARTETYHLLSTLQSKGIVSATFEHPIKFSAIPIHKAMKTLVDSEKQRIKTLEKQETQLSKLWESIPEFAQKTSNEENKFQMLQGTNPINSKISEIIENTKDEICVLGSEKDFMKFYHADFLTKLSEEKPGFRILSGCTEKTEYVFEGIKKEQIRKLNDDANDKLCFIIKDDSEMLFFTKNHDSSSNEIMAMWTDSSSMIYSMKLLFDFMWSANSK